ncbi:hypothetical protein B9T31_03440 [Acinetobacter sp. ANC 4558]|uniref:TonB-dependent siderophore receptor n=1 Tax=Acinetobacter sp. ANC 4558 TaxID=1977876 RepID=UPI000A339090|nr:TonB-dependent siderophore receptor [Acinetobacter sp. ANC 4558]OTG87567.1 hypothetical protein B9T31_03440 [Acinetobacter sp. ANC 4558]
MKQPLLQKKYLIIACSAVLASMGIQAQEHNDQEQSVEQTSGLVSVLPTISVRADSDQATTEHSQSYTTKSMSTGTRLALSMRKTPQSVSVISRQQIEDRNFVSLDQAMELAPGITSSTRNLNRVSYTARGFAFTENMVDGMPSMADADAGFTPNLAFFDRVEILRGAAGLIYGTGSAGGAVNLVRKMPTATPQASINLQRGSWDNYYSEFDVSGPLNKDATVRGRFVAAYQDRENFIDLEYTRKPAFYGIVETDIGDKTTVFLGTSYEKMNSNIAPGGLPRYRNGDDLKLSRSSRGMAPAWNYWDGENTTIFSGLKYNFNPDWSLRLAANYQDRNQQGNAINVRGAVDPVTSKGPQYPAFEDSYSSDRRMAFDAQLSGKFSLFNQTHDIVVGTTLSKIKGTENWARKGSRPVSDDTIFGFDPYGVKRPVLGPKVDSLTLSTFRNVGAYTTLRLSITDDLKVITGARLSSIYDDIKNRSTGIVTKRKQTNELSPYFGIVYDLSSTLSLYTSYSDIFTPQNTRFTRQGTPLDPVVGANYEAGIKGEFYDGALNTSFAVFRIDESNRAYLDVEAPCSGSPDLGACYIAEGKVRGEGYEFEVSGELFPRLETSMGYTHVNTKYIKDKTNEGKAFRSTTPENLLKIWAKYQLSGAWSDWSIGAGVNAQSSTYNTSGALKIEQSGYALWSIQAGYKINQNWNSSLSINNLFDKVYYQRLGTEINGNRYGEPRSVMLSVRGKY